MHRRIDLTLIAAVAVTALAASLLLPVGDADATVAIAKRETLACTACHDKPGSKLLTDEGLYYEVTGSLKGYKEVEGAFGKCTYCHVTEPGAEKLTVPGERLLGVVEDMEDLQEWVVESHPEAIRQAIEAAEGAPRLEVDEGEPEEGVELELDEPEGPEEPESEGGEA